MMTSQRWGELWHDIKESEPQPWYYWSTSSAHVIISLYPERKLVILSPVEAGEIKGMWGKDKNISLPFLNKWNVIILPLIPICEPETNFSSKQKYLSYESFLEMLFKLLRRNKETITSITRCFSTLMNWQVCKSNTMIHSVGTLSVVCLRKSETDKHKQSLLLFLSNYDRFTDILIALNFTICEHQAIIVFHTCKGWLANYA